MCVRVRARVRARARVVIDPTTDDNTMPVAADPYLGHLVFSFIQISLIYIKQRTITDPSTQFNFSIQIVYFGLILSCTDVHL